ncbi:MAG TPA: queuosine salvage family protein [Solirubrobacteraceae bacterium]|jgi:hypothetical protein
MPLAEYVRSHCAEIAGRARLVSIDLDAAAEVSPGPAPDLDPDCHFLEGEADEVASYLLTLAAINFGSGWFPLLEKRTVAGRPLSGYFTIAWALTDSFRARGPWSADELQAMTSSLVAETLGQRPGLELMALYAQALRSLGAFLGERSALRVVEEAGGSAQRLAASLARGMAMFDDTGFYKRAQIAASDLALAGIAQFRDLDELTIFADNLVPHVLRCDGVLIYEDALAAHVDAGRTLPMGAAEREIRACAVHACELISRRTGVPPRTLDAWLWDRGQAPEYKARPRHRCRTVFY